MQSYTLKDTWDHYQEVFKKAITEPILVTQQSQSSHVIMSAEAYGQILKRVEILEDMVLGKAAEIALKESQMVGKETFTSTLESLINGET